MKKFLSIYLFTLPVMLILDYLWLGVIAKNFYQKYLGFILRDDLLWIAVVVFYLLYLFGLLIFVVIPALEKNSIKHAFKFGALFGLVLYAIYDLSNYATIKFWPLAVVFVDVIWGVIVTSVVSGISYVIGKKLFKTN